MPNQPVDPNQDFGANLGTFLVCMAAAVMVFTAIGNPTPGAIAIAAVLTVCAAGLVAWRIKAGKAYKDRN